MTMEKFFKKHSRFLLIFSSLNVILAYPLFLVFISILFRIGGLMSKPPFSEQVIGIIMANVILIFYLIVFYFIAEIFTPVTFVSIKLRKKIILWISFILLNFFLILFAITTNPHISLT